MKEILDVSQEEYFNLPYLSQSAIKDFRNKGAWSYYHEHVKQEILPSPPSDSMRIGSALHAILCKDIPIDSVIAIQPEWFPSDPQPERINRRKKAHREYLADWAENYKNKIHLSGEEMTRVLGMRESVINNPAISSWMERLGSDRSEVVATNDVNGLTCKAMCDADFSDEGLIIDFKTTRQHLNKDFIRDAIYKFGYQYQAAHYCDVFEAKTFMIVAIRNFAPFETMVFEVTEEMIGQARMLNYQTIDRIKWCTQMDEWHSDGWGEIINIEDVLNNE